MPIHKTTYIDNPHATFAIKGSREGGHIGSFIVNGIPSKVELTQESEHYVRYDEPTPFTIRLKHDLGNDPLTFAIENGQYIPQNKADFGQIIRTKDENGVLHFVVKGAKVRVIALTEPVFAKPLPPIGKPPEGYMPSFRLERIKHSHSLKPILQGDRYANR